MIAWLIEWPADRQSPVRYWHPTDGHVIDPNHAVRFCRQEDAEAVLKRDALRGAKAVEHKFGLAEVSNRETIARLINPSAWRVLDSYLAIVKKKPNCAYDPDNFQHRESLALADQIIASLRA